MAVEIRNTTIEDLRVYQQKNPVKFAHKFGDLDFSNLPTNFENMIPYYKKLVATERATRASQNRPENIPAITPWIFEMWKPKAEVKAEPAQESVVAPVVEPVAEAKVEAPAETTTASNPEANTAQN